MFLRLDQEATSGTKEDQALALIIFQALANTVSFRDNMIINVILQEAVSRAEKYRHTSPNLAKQLNELIRFCQRYSGQLPQQQDAS